MQIGIGRFDDGAGPGGIRRRAAPAGDDVDNGLAALGADGPEPLVEVRVPVQDQVDAELFQDGQDVLASPSAAVASDVEGRLVVGDDNPLGGPGGPGGREVLLEPRQHLGGRLVHAHGLVDVILVVVEDHHVQVAVVEAVVEFVVRQVEQLAIEHGIVLVVAADGPDSGLGQEVPCGVEKIACPVFPDSAALDEVAGVDEEGQGQLRLHGPNDRAVAVGPGACVTVDDEAEGVLRVGAWGRVEDALCAVASAGDDVAIGAAALEARDLHRVEALGPVLDGRAADARGRLGAVGGLRTGEEPAAACHAAGGHPEDLGGRLVDVVDVGPDDDVLGPLGPLTAAGPQKQHHEGRNTESMHGEPPVQEGQRPRGAGGPPNGRKYQQSKDY